MSVALMAMPRLAVAITDELNAMRLQGCEQRVGAPRSLTRTTQLDQVAREWSRGGRLHDAIVRTQQRLASSASMYAGGTNDERALISALVERNCEALVNPVFTEVGIYQQGQGVWVVLAERTQMPSSRQREAIARQALLAVNAARAQPRHCGEIRYAAVPPLEWSAQLERAAREHASDMAQHSHFDHIGSDGSRVGVRVTRKRFSWRHVGENIAAGVSDVEVAMKGWLDSPGHCANIMSPRFTHMGIAYVVRPKSEAGIYWAQVFAAPSR